MRTHEVQPCTLLFHAEDRESIWREAFARHAPQVRFCSWPDWQTEDDAEYALVWKPRPGQLARHRALKAIFSVGAGIDHLRSDPELPPGVPVIRMVDPTLTRGMREYVVLQVLQHHRDMPEYLAQQARRIWRPRSPVSASARTAGVMGVGVLGRAVLDSLKPFGFQLRAWSRSHKRLDGVAHFAGPNGLADFLDGLDILVCLLPLTDDTRGILDRALFEGLPRGAAVINAGRGEHLVEADLLAALESGRIRAASLDVFVDEPLPDGHPFWNHPKIIVTPHVASMTSPHTAVPGVLAQIRRHQQGGAFTHVADLDRGY